MLCAPAFRIAVRRGRVHPGRSILYLSFHANFDVLDSELFALRCTFGRCTIRHPPRRWAAEGIQHLDFLAVQQTGLERIELIPLAMGHSPSL